jgi:2-(1,2-epoxy-1,2-dihydrophenyl)acetyl-CoA isomerase
MSTYLTLLYEQRDSVAVITLNRPDRRNAVTHELLTELYDAFGRAEQERSVCAVVLTGAGKSFCAGQDLSAFGGPSTSESVQQTVLNFYKPVILRMCSMGKPIIGAINGAAAGAGASLALACDLRVMAEDASLVMAFSNIGLAPDAGASWFLVRQVGYSRALEIAIEGERISAQRCLALGLTNRVAAGEALLSMALAWAAHLAQRPTLAIGLTKRVMNEALQDDLETVIHREAELQGITIASADHREGVAAFLEKRKPVFRDAGLAPN